MEQQKVRIRFCKQGDLRLIGHRDLARTFERLFRRAAMPLSMSQGYHPKARLSFPCALALGIEGTNEVMEVLLTHSVDMQSLVESLRRHAPSGLTVVRVATVAATGPKMKVQRVAYELPVPPERCPATAEAIRSLRAEPAHWVHRRGRAEPIDLLANLEDLRLVDGTLRMTQRVTPVASASPRDILQALGSADLEGRAGWLTRTAVEIVS